MLRNDPDRDWERFGAEDPYYAVLNAESYRTARLTDALIAEVLRSGESDIQTLIGFAEQQFGPQARGRALEFGCGVGRLLLPLGARFSSVTGLDTSTSMLHEAASNCRRQGLDNVQLLRTDDLLSGVGGDYDFVVSYLVLQHIPMRRGERIIRELLRRVAPGGVAALHVTTARSTPRWRHVVHVLRRNFLPLHHLGNLVSGMRWNEPLMQTNLYDLDRIHRLVAGAGLTGTVSLPIQHADHVGRIVFARRPAAAVGSGPTARDQTGTEPTGAP